MDPVVATVGYGTQVVHSGSQVVDPVVGTVVSVYSSRVSKVLKSWILYSSRGPSCVTVSCTQTQVVCLEHSSRGPSCVKLKESLRDRIVCHVT